MGKIVISYENIQTSSKTTNWDVKIFIAVISNPDEVETLMVTLLPGVLNRLQAAHTVSAVITQRDKIYNIFANDNTRYQVQSNRTPTLYGGKAVEEYTAPDYAGFDRG